MNAVTYHILTKQKASVASLTTINDFELRVSGDVPAQTILTNPHISLYALDFENQQAVFVETPAALDLTQEPFVFMAQYDHALQVLTISFETMIQLARQVNFDPQRLVVIQSVGRCGSTLASQIFAQVPGVVNISEPDALTMLVAARQLQLASEAELLALLDASVRLQCKTAASRAWVIKGRSYIMELADWFYQLYPQARTLFLYRDAESWLRSAYRAFIGQEERTAEAFREKLLNMRRRWGMLSHLIDEYPPEKELTAVGILSLKWLSVMVRYVQATQYGHKMLTIPFQNWKTSPHETAVTMLTYANCTPGDWHLIDGVLAQDSQAGTYLAQTAIKEKSGVMAQLDISEYYHHLDNTPLLKTADFEAANTLKLPTSPQN